MLVGQQQQNRTRRKTGTEGLGILMTIPLDPGMGGQSVGLDALHNADIIVSTTPALISRLIRRATASTVSHAMLYIGGGQVVEAIGEGVRLRPLATAVQDASLAVAYRHPMITEMQALRARDFAGHQIGKAYDSLGIVGQAGFQLDRRVFCLNGNIECIRRVGRNNMRIQQTDKFFCSELVWAAFQKAGIPLTATPPSWNSPDDIPNLWMRGNINYVGHLKT